MHTWTASACFLQDDWRANQRLVLNLGVRFDFYPAFQRESDERAVRRNRQPRIADGSQQDGFRSRRDRLTTSTTPTWFNVGPRVGFAWTLDEAGKTVIRGGAGVLFSPIMLALIQNNVADPFIGAATNYNRTDLAARGLKWPNYADDIQDAVLADNAGKKAIYSLIDPDIRAPYTVQSMINIQRSFGDGLDGRGRIHPHRRPKLPAQPAVGQCVRSPDRRAPESGARHAERRLSHQRADDGLQRAAGVGAAALR